MLYVTTRNNRDAYTANRALRENRGPDGGFYLPFRAPSFSQEEIAALTDKTFGQCVAEVLNRLFPSDLKGWDVDFCIGRHPIRLETLRHRIIMAESWHNPKWDYDSLVNNLTDHLSKEEIAPGDWLRIAVRIAILFGIFGELQRSGVKTADISVVSGDFSVPISAWYARQWGLPIGNIICCCNENNRVWDLICQGQMRTDGVCTTTLIPEADVAVPVDLERLIFECGGISEVGKYLEVCQTGKTYSLNDVVAAKMRKGLYVSVISSERIKSTIPSAYRTHNYLLSSSFALAYSGLLDYRAKTGETRHAIVWAEKSPMQDAMLIAGSLGVSEEEIRRQIL